MSSVAWHDDWARGLDRYYESLHESVYGLALRYAAQIERHMKQTAPWTDRTGGARQSLWAQATRTPSGADLVFGHGVEHGWFLETSNQSRFSIVLPTFDATSLALIADLGDMLR